MTSRGLRESSSFLARKALPNILVHFEGIPSDTDQLSILKQIERSIDSLYGVDRFVVYSVKADELVGDSRTYSASVLLLIHHQSEPSEEIFHTKLPQLALPLDRLCPNAQLDEKYFASAIEKYISNEDAQSEVESSLYDDTAVYLLDSKRGYDTWLRMLDKKSNLIDYDANNGIPPKNFDDNDVFYIDWQRDSRLELDGFNVSRYFNNLETNYFGRTLVFADKVSTTMELITRFKQVNGAVAVANYQTAGIGRNANKWLSPKGCAMFTINLLLPSSSPIVARLPLLQHLASLSVVLALPAAELDVKIKWPNDILFGESMSKLVGILTRSYCYGNQINVQFGIGINLSNRHPSVCLDDVVALYNSRLPEGARPLEPIARETLFARTFNHLERLVDMLSEGGDRRLAEIKQMYIDNWVHSDALIEVRDSQDETKERSARIRGINDDGYLLAEDLATGELIPLKPDGNRFDLMHNLVILNV